MGHDCWPDRRRFRRCRPHGLGKLRSGWCYGRPPRYGWACKNVSTTPAASRRVPGR